MNEALNAGTPFTSDGERQYLLRPMPAKERLRLYAIGRPIFIAPARSFNGHDKAFFFFNFEQFRQTIITNNVSSTLPTLAYRNGNFSQALTGRNLGTDGLGRTLFENTVYDPNSNFVVNGVTYRNPFNNNTIPATELDPVALKIQNFIPLPTSSGLINNFLPTYANPSEAPFRPSKSVITR